MSAGKAKYALVRAISWASLFLERLWRSYWPAFSLLFAFTGLACLGVITFFGAAVHLALLLGFAGAAFYFFIRPLVRFRLPRTADVRRSIERQSGLAHRPLEALTDRPADGTAADAQELWRKYQSRLQNALTRVKPHLPAPNVAPRDRYALRYAALAVLALGLLAARQDAGFRLLSAVSLDMSKWIKSAPIALDVWITPPAYTGVSPVFLATTQLGTTPTPGNIRVPENSVLKIRVSGYADAPRMTLGQEHPAFTHPSARSYALEMKLHTSGTLTLKQGFFRTLGTWPVYVTPDAPPDIAILGTEKTQQGALKINYTAKDDFGITSIFGTITPPADIAKALDTGPATFAVPVSSNDTDSYSHVEDLTASPFAGSSVTLTMTAADDAGNKTTSAPVTLTLPERTFSNPVARAIAAERKRLIWYNNALTRRVAMGNLAAIANNFAGYHYDNRVFLGLVVAVKRLGYEGQDTDAVKSLIPLLWDIAMRVEDGGLSMAGRDLSDALQRLSDALKNKDISKGELQELMNDVRQKMRQYVKTLAQEMRQQMQNGQDIPALSPELARKFMQHIDMGKMLQEMQQLSQGGEREQMQKMAEYLKKSVDNLDLNRMRQMRQAQRDQINALNDLQQLIERQQSLLDQTNKMPDKNERGQNSQTQRQQPRPSQGQDQRQTAQNQGKSHSEQPGKRQEDKQGSRPRDDKNGKDAPSGKETAGGQKSSQATPPPQPDNAEPFMPQNSDGNADNTNGEDTGNDTAQNGGQNPAPIDQPQQGGRPQPQNSGDNGQDEHGTQNDASAPPQPTPQMGQNGQEAPMPAQQGEHVPSPLGTQGKGLGQGQTAQGRPQNNAPAAAQRQGRGTGTGNGMDGADTNGAPLNIDTPAEGAREQGVIRGKLGDIMRKLGEGLPQIPENFGKSDQAMENAQNALKNGAPRSSANAQQEALAQLQQGLDKTLQQMAKQMNAVMTFGSGAPSENGNYGEGFDPLGRQTDKDGKLGVQDIQLPDGKEQRRVQKILKELRDRSGDYSRPKVERDYIDRLLDQFN